MPRILFWCVIFFPYIPLFFLLVSQNPVKITGKITIKKEMVFMPKSYVGIVENPHILSFYEVYSPRSVFGGTDVLFSFANVRVATNENYIWYPP